MMDLDMPPNALLLPATPIPSLAASRPWTPKAAAVLFCPNTPASPLAVMPSTPRPEAVLPSTNVAVTWPPTLALPPAEILPPVEMLPPLRVPPALRPPLTVALPATLMVVPL